MKKSPLILLPLLALLGCDDTNDGKITIEQARLRRFESCGELRRALEIRRQSPPPPVDAVALEGSSIAEGNEVAAAPLGETANLQTAGVDELDVIKADADFIYQLKNDLSLVVLRRSPIGQASAVQKIENAGVGAALGIFVRENQVVTLSQEYGYSCGGPYPVSVGPEGALTLGRSMSIACNTPSCTCSITPPILRLNYFERRGDGTLNGIGARTIEGTFSGARFIGKHLHLVTTSAIADPQTEESDVGLPKTEFASQNSPVTECTSVYYEPAVMVPDGIGPVADSLLCVLTVDTDKPDGVPKGECLMADTASVVYASQENMFVASYGWDQTPIHQFEFGDDEKETRYVGSGIVPGHLLNSFSMDEFDGYLRVASSSQGGGGCVMREDGADICEFEAPANQISIMKLSEGSDLSTVGKIEGVAVGEQIYASRFMGKKGFLVTFRQVDPLFAMDLSDPRNPAIKGQLKVPGFSTGLYPMEDGYLLGVGSDADESGIVTGLALSIFDVRDLSAPALLHKIKLGARGTYSEAYDNPHALRYAADKDLVILPISATQADWQVPDFNGFQIFHAAVADGFKLLGESAFSNGGTGYYYYGDSSRSFIRDDVIDLAGGGELALRATSDPATDLVRLAIP
ncbi:MAG TPA: beta-propeller domain-containing protein [Bdellovibrionota bacterium]|nr:beta-propeller domain-containing protein [Bdellovibrionota bacterium]